MEEEKKLIETVTGKLERDDRGGMKAAGITTVLLLGTAGFKYIKSWETGKDLRDYYDVDYLPSINKSINNAELLLSDFDSEIREKVVSELVSLKKDLFRGMLSLSKKWIHSKCSEFDRYAKVSIRNCQAYLLSIPIKYKSIDSFKELKEYVSLIIRTLDIK